MAVKRATKKAGKKAAVSSKKEKVNVRVKRTSPATKKKSAIKEKQTRIQIFQHIAEETGLTKTQVESVFSTLSEHIGAHMRPRGSGEYTIPMSGIKISRVKKKATRARKMISPLTNQEVVIAAKPARNVIKLRALKVLKETVEK